MNHLFKAEILSELLEVINQQQTMIEHQNKLIATLTIDNAEKENFISKVPDPHK